MTHFGKDAFTIHPWHCHIQQYGLDPVINQLMVSTPSGVPINTTSAP